METTRVLFVCSSGGHLDQVLALLPQPAGVEITVATFLKPDAIPKLEGIRHFGLHWPTNRSLKALVINTHRAFRIILRERPHVVVSSGAAAAVPFFYVAKVMSRAQTVFIECFDRIDNPTLTARLVKPATDMYLCQWDTQLPDFPRRRQVMRSR